eukprot:335379_1
MSVIVPTSGGCPPWMRNAERVMPLCNSSLGLDSIQVLVPHKGNSIIWELSNLCQPSPLWRCGRCYVRYCPCGWAQPSSGLQCGTYQASLQQFAEPPLHLGSSLLIGQSDH